MKRAILSVCVATLLAACAQTPTTQDRQKTITGTAIGAGAGAILGNIAAGKGDRTKGAIIGGAIGATVGGLIGRQMDKQEAELRQQMAGSGVEVQRQGDTIRLQAPENITFDTGSAQLKPQFRPVLNQLANSIQQYPNTVVQIEGHTDSTGSASFNQTLSENRAQSVRSYLIQQGVDANRLVAVGYGATRPIADNSTAAGRAQNRRVEVLIVPEQAATQNQPR